MAVVAHGICWSTPRSPATYQENVIWSEFTTMASDQIKLGIDQFVLSDFSLLVATRGLAWMFGVASLTFIINEMVCHMNENARVMFFLNTCTYYMKTCPADMRTYLKYIKWLRYMCCDISLYCNFYTMIFFCRKLLNTFMQRYRNIKIWLKYENMSFEKRSTVLKEKKTKRKNLIY